MRKMTAKRYQALQQVVMAAARRDNPKRAAKRARQAAKRKAEREETERKVKIAK